MLTLRKSEVSSEFISLVGFILIVFISVLIIVGLRYNDVSESIIFSEAQNMANLIANEINFAASMEGYYREFSIPKKLVNNIEYNVSINTDFRFVEVKWDDKKAIANIITERVSGTVEPGLIKIKIKNDEGLVLIES
ncbi:MAG: hypothetical protein GTN36_04030 [Candidatus Aenigmarchaeota archaeon]|nr:hypothetical protein [Candidatus Aenigmarchaeota archaeon]